MPRGRRRGWWRPQEGRVPAPGRWVHGLRPELPAVDEAAAGLALAVLGSANKYVHVCAAKDLGQAGRWHWGFKGRGRAPLGGILIEARATSWIVYLMS